LYYFVCMMFRMKCIELTLLSCLIARAFHVIGVICYISCHFIGATGQRHETLLWAMSNGDGSANKSDSISIDEWIRLRSRWSSPYLIYLEGPHITIP
jgi:hypothetical protein